jgi:putative ABC transport system ATP-binding protein
MTVQKIVPKFFTQSFSLILQIIVGLVLVSFYHPIFLIFSLSIFASIYFIWSIYSKKATFASFSQSKNKYEFVGWLSELGFNNRIFKTCFGQDYGKFKIDLLTQNYVKERKSYFRHLFSQVILLLCLYAIASSILLVIGGWLVLKGQLTLGQLVAAELVLSTVLYGISQFGKDFGNFYELVAACEKISQFYNIELDKKSGIKLDDCGLDITLSQVEGIYCGNKYFFNLSFLKEKNYFIATSESSIQKLLIDLLSGFFTPSSGTMEFNNLDICDIDGYSLRSKIAVIDNDLLLDGTIEEYLTFNNKIIKAKQIITALSESGFGEIMNKIGLNLQSSITPSGWQFCESDKVLLKIARAILLQPKLIIITEIFDIVRPSLRSKVLRNLTNIHNTKIIYFSNRRDEIIGFDEYLFFDHKQNFVFNNIEDLTAFEQKF